MNIFIFFFIIHLVGGALLSGESSGSRGTHAYLGRPISLVLIKEWGIGKGVENRIDVPVVHEFQDEYVSGSKFPRQQGEGNGRMTGMVVWLCGGRKIMSEKVEKSFKNT